MNKKAGEKYLSLWWFGILVVISIALIVGISSNIFSEVNVKKLEANALAERVASCISANLPSFMSNSFDVSKECSILKSSEKRYFKIEICKNSSCENPLKTSFQGDLSLKCFSGVSGNVPSCSEKYFYAVINSQQVVIKITTASNIQGGREII
jgi:hypothetical protein